MNKHKIIISLFVFLVILLLPNCAIKKRVEATPMPTHIEKPPELLWQDATRFLRNKKCHSSLTSLINASSRFSP